MGIILIVGALLASFIPSAAFFFWFRNTRKDDPEYKTICRQVLISGILSVIPVVFVSMTINILMNLTLNKQVSPVMREFLYTFFVLAFAEELVKGLTGNKYIKKHRNMVNRMDVAAFMTIAACGFNILESIVYSFGSNIIQILVRGITALHEFYGLIMGYFVGKSIQTGKKSYLAAAFGIPWFLHGLYDFSLREELLNLSDNFVILPFAAILLAWIIGFSVFFKLRKGKNDPVFTEPLYPKN